MYNSEWQRIVRATEIVTGFGMTLTGLQTCGDYMFSGHTAYLTIFNHLITECKFDCTKNAVWLSVCFQPVDLDLTALLTRSNHIKTIQKLLASKRTKFLEDSLMSLKKKKRFKIIVNAKLFSRSNWPFLNPIFLQLELNGRSTHL